MTADLAATGVPPRTSPERIEEAAKYMEAVLQSLGFDTSGDGVARTPERFVKALDELTWGRHLDPARHLEVTFPSEGDSPITVRRIPVTSICEHHLLPFDGWVTVSYQPRPGARIVGLSKLARLAQEFAARATVQERVTNQIADAVAGGLDTIGVAVLMVSDHSCMSLRGARAHEASTVTDAYRGVFLDPTVQIRFHMIVAVDR